MNKFSIALALSVACLMAETLGMEKIIIQATEDDQFAMDNKDSEKFAKKAITSLGTQANMNPYSVMQFSPSVNFSPADLAGSNEPSFHDPIRIRSKSQSGPGGVYMINSIPLSSNPGGGKTLVDMENISAINLYKGYLPVDKNIGFSSLIGKVDMSVLAPKNHFAATLSQSFGSENFKKTFMRVDTPKVGDFAFFASYSYTGSDKYKGKGDLERQNAMIGASYKKDDLKAEAYFVRNSDDHHNYDSLSYAEAKNLDKYYRKDFAKIRPTTNNDVNYYDWNKQDFVTTAIFADVVYEPTDKDKIVFKPYYKHDKGDYWFLRTPANPMMNMMNRVINWDIDHDLYGAIASYEHKFANQLKTKVGYWQHNQQPPGPPSKQIKYKNVGGNLVYDGYALLSDNDYHKIDSPFVEASGEVGSFDYRVGGQYQTFKLGAIDSHTYDNNASTKGWASVDSRTFYTFLPSLYVAYKIDDESSVYFDYSRTYGFDVNLYPTYSNQIAKFYKNGTGKKLQELWGKTKLETSDNIDLGYKTTINDITINPVAYLAFVKNKQATVLDDSFGVEYPMNVGEALGYGAELSAKGAIRDDLEFLLALSYNKYSFTENFKTQSGETDIKGNQLPDAPEILAKGALSYTINGFAITPSARYTSSRYGNVENTEKIKAYTIVDLDVSYKKKNFYFAKEGVFRASITNLTNEKYISTIVTADNVLAADQGSTTYQTGAPFGFYVSANLNF